MTFGEILARVNFKIWGNSTVPSGSQAVLSGDEGFIANAHQQLQWDYNYWFQSANAVIATVSGTQNYSLPSDFKEPINILYKITGKDYFSNSLIPLGMSEDTDYWWQVNNTTQEYSTHYKYLDDSIVLYPTPNAARSLHVVYWKIFDRPTSAFTDTSSTESDDVTDQAHELIVNLAAAEMCDVLEEFNKAQVFRQQAVLSADALKKKDARRRQNYLRQHLMYRDY